MYFINLLFSKSLLSAIPAKNYPMIWKEFFRMQEVLAHAQRLLLQNRISHRTRFKLHLQIENIYNTSMCQVQLIIMLNTIYNKPFKNESTTKNVFLCVQLRYSVFKNSWWARLIIYFNTKVIDKEYTDTLSILVFCPA